jgi:hypothetical protein
MKPYRSYSTAIAGVAMLLVAALPSQAAPQSTKATSPVVRQLQFAIEAEVRTVDPLVIAPGDGFRIKPGQRLVIRAVGNARTNERTFPGVRYFVAAGNDISLDDARPNMGTVAVDARSSSRGENAVIGYEILGNTVLDGVAREGQIQVQVDGPRANSGVAAAPAYDSSRDLSEGTANTLLRDLYRGILLREPDPAASPWRDKIEVGGYNGLVEVARAIAASEESRASVYERGIGNEQRLAALYLHLLGRQQSQVARTDWDRGLQLLAARQYPELVTELIGLADFYTRYRLQRRF